jgi:hypothetical protein
MTFTFPCSGVSLRYRLWLLKKEPIAVISVNFSVYGERTFNKLRTNFVVKIPRKEFFNSHA